MNAQEKISVRLSAERLSLDEVLKALQDPANGAQIVFTGVVRNHNQGKKVNAVSYDAFAPLVEKTFLEICGEAQAQWGGPKAGGVLRRELRIMLFHRIGRLEVGDISVVIAVGSPHRDEAYQASRYIIENLKTRAPIWKQEHYEEGDSEWLQGHALCGH